MKSHCVEFCWLLHKHHPRSTIRSSCGAENETRNTMYHNDEPEQDEQFQGELNKLCESPGEVDRVESVVSSLSCCTSHEADPITHVTKRATRQM
jgi:hypothetical protein